MDRWCSIRAQHLARGHCFSKEMTMSFNDLGLQEALTKAVTESGYDTATEVQALAIPAALAGHDMMVSARTGSGKTASFILDRKSVV